MSDAPPSKVRKLSLDSAALLEQRRAGRFCDIIVRSSDGQRFPAHKLILHVGSEQIHDQLESSQESSEIFLPFVGDVVCLCLDVIYGVTPILDAADKLAVADAASFLQLDVLLELALNSYRKEFGSSDWEAEELIELWDRCNRLVREAAPSAAMLRNDTFAVLIESSRFNTITSHPAWLHASRELVRNVLFNAVVPSSDEPAVLAALTSWLAAQPKVEASDVVALLELVRMTPLFKDVASRESALPSAAMHSGASLTDAVQRAEWLKALLDAMLEAAGENFSARRAIASWLDGAVAKEYSSHLRLHPPSLIAQARSELVFDNAPCLEHLLQAAMVTEAPPERQARWPYKTMYWAQARVAEMKAAERFSHGSDGAWKDLPPQKQLFVTVLSQLVSAAKLDGKDFTITDFTGAALVEVERYIAGALRRIGQHLKSTDLSAQTLQEAVEAVLPGDLSRHAVKEMETSARKERREGFGLSHFERTLPWISSMSGLSVVADEANLDARIHTVTEYLAAEVAELAGYKAINDRAYLRECIAKCPGAFPIDFDKDNDAAFTILPAHVLSAISSDDELRRVPRPIWD